MATARHYLTLFVGVPMLVMSFALAISILIHP